MLDQRFVNDNMKMHLPVNSTWHRSCKSRTVAAGRAVMLLQSTRRVCSHRLSRALLYSQELAVFPYLYPEICEIIAK